MPLAKPRIVLPVIVAYVESGDTGSSSAFVNSVPSSDRNTPVALPAPAAALPLEVNVFPLTTVATAFPNIHRPASPPDTVTSLPDTVTAPVALRTIIPMSSLAPPTRLMSFQLTVLPPAGTTN